MNVLLVISDQHQAKLLGCEGHKQAITPHMDRLAAEGVRFRHAYTQNPICTPSRVSILSGQYCHNTGYYGLSGPTPTWLPSFFGHFKQHGYRTAGIGKMHLPNDPKVWAIDDMTLYADSYEKHGHPMAPNTPYFKYLEDLGLRDKEDSIGLPELPGLQQHEGRPSNLPYEHSVEGWCAAQAMKFIDASGDTPFCMQVSLPRPHQCYTPDQQFWDMYPDDLELPPTIDQDPSARPPHFRNTVNSYRKAEGAFEPKGRDHVSRRVWRAYLACITQCDYALGQLVDHLEATGKLDNTIVVYGSDHGAYSTTHGVPEKAPGICSEEVCRVPFIWRLPEVAQAGHVAHELVENVDIAPTIASLAGLPAMDWTDGRDITALLRGEPSPVRDVAVTEHPWSKSIRWKNWRMVHYQPEMFDEPAGELYDIAGDPNESTNLFFDDAHQSTVNEGRQLLLEWLIRTTRTTTMWPPEHWSRGPGAKPYTLGADGKQSNTAGPTQSVAAGRLNYI